MSEKCESQNIVDSIEAIDNNDDKLRYVDVIIAQCGKGGKKVVAKTDKRMNAWICYLKTCAKKTDNTYLDCVKDKPRAKKEYYPKKDYWDSQALKGCPL